MPVTSSGQISLNDLHVEAGGTSGTQASMNDSDIRSMIGASSGQANLSFSGFYGASSSVDIALTIASNTNNYNLFSNRGGSYEAGKSNVTLTINSGVTVGSTSTGAYAFDTGTGWASGDTITIVNNGTITGKGGRGGNGGSATKTGTNSWSSTAGTNGSTGGNGVRLQFATTIANNGAIYGGGGGGGGGYAHGTYDSKGGYTTAYGGSGGGGGAGTQGGAGGSGGTGTGDVGIIFPSANGGAGSAGSATAAGFAGATANIGGAGRGGNGGANGANGVNSDTNTQGGAGLSQPTASGGTRGYYLVGNSFATYTATGTRTGRVS
jgi:hypothetical protein